MGEHIEMEASSYYQVGDRVRGLYFSVIVTSFNNHHGYVFGVTCIRNHPVSLAERESFLISRRAKKAGCDE